MGQKKVSNQFTVNTVEDGQSAPYYFQEWFAWSNDATTASVTKEPTIGGSWATSIPAQGSYAYLWRKSIRMVYNATTNGYDAETAQYFRMSGTNGTSIKTKGSVIAVISRRGTFPTTDVEDGDIVIKDYDRTPYVATVRGMIVQWDAMSNADDGDSYTVIKTCYYSPSAQLNPPDVKGHLFSYSEEASKWLDLGMFQGENGETYYNHVAWATNVDTSTTPITVTGFVTTKSPNDTEHIWMGVLVDQNSGQDSSNAALYTWSNTKGDGAAVATCSPDKISIPCNADGSVVSTNGYNVSFGLKVGSIDISQYITNVTHGSLPTGVSITSAPVAYGKTIIVANTATATGMAYGITFTVSASYSGKTYSSTVNVALIGAKQGSVGERGKVGRFFYYGGTFDTNDNTPFPISDAQAPYFDYIKDGQKRYAVYNPANNPAGGSLKMSQMTPLSQGLPDLNTTGTSWETMTNDFKYIITEAIFGSFAHFGSAIISGDWMLSTNGTINDVAYNNGALYNGAPAYTWFDPQYPNKSVNTAHSVNGKEWTGYNFVPNYAVDLLTGATYQQNAYVNGSVITKSIGIEFADLRSMADDSMFVVGVDTTVGGTNISGIWNFKTKYQTIFLPTNKYANYGQRVILYNPTIGLGGANGTTIVCGEIDNQRLTTLSYLRGVGINYNSSKPYEPIPLNAYYPVESIHFLNGVVELMCVPTDEQGQLCEWVVVNIGTNIYSMTKYEQL